MTATSLPSADGDFIRGVGSAGPLAVPTGLSRVDFGLLGGVALLSTALLFWATGDAVLAAGFVAGLAVAVGGVVLARRLFPAAVSSEAVLPDWTMLRQAVNHDDIAIAGTDRASRRIISSGAFRRSNGSTLPPKLPAISMDLRAARSGTPA